MQTELNVAPPRGLTYTGVYDNGVIRLTTWVNWPAGTPVEVSVAEVRRGEEPVGRGPVIIAGFGLAGRGVADICDRHDLEYVIVEQNLETIEAQRRLGRTVIEGDISREEVMRAAGIERAALLVLTIPDEQAALAATALARGLRPDLPIITRTSYCSSGLKATALGADCAIPAEQAVARQTYETMLCWLATARLP